MENTLGKKPVDAPKKDTRRTLPVTRANEQVEPVTGESAKVADDGRLKQSISVGKKPEIRKANIAGLNTSGHENG